MKERILDWTFIIALALLITLMLTALPVAAVWSFTGNVYATNEPGCVELGIAQGETLFLCESDLGVRCVWDPSPALGAGVMDCEW